jgi:hypothetical protein
LSLVFAFAAVTVGGAMQDEGDTPVVYEVVPDANGTGLVRRAIATDPETQQLIAETHDRFTIADMEKTGVEEILGLFAGNEFSEELILSTEQRRELETLRKSYAAELSAITNFDSSQINSLRARFGKQVWKILREDQIAELADQSIRRDRRYLSLIYYPDVSRSLGLSRIQIEKLKSQSKELNESLERSKKIIDEELQKCRASVQDTLEGVLNDSQRKKFDKLRGLKFLESMSIDDMVLDTAEKNSH